MNTNQTVTVSEKLLFERSTKNRIGVSFPPLDVPEKTLETSLLRKNLDLPELSEPDVVRHYTRLSHWNFSIDQNFYPLGSCTMKYNPKINEWGANQGAFSFLHPNAPEDSVQGALELMWELQEMLKELTGMDGATLLPLAGAQGEFTGLKLIRAFHENNKETRNKILIPDTAHGTNPATCTLAGFEVLKIPTTQEGLLSIEHIQKALSQDVAALMITNPNTLGYWEENLKEITDLLHKNGSLVYCDGANFNAFVGLAKIRDFGVDVMHINLHKTFSTPHGGGGPGSGPVVFIKKLEPFQPIPVIKKNNDKFSFEWDRPQSIGALSTFYGNFGMLVRAYIYIKTLGIEGLKHMSQMAVLNANYIRARLKNYYDLPFPRKFCLHETIFSDKKQTPYGVTTLDIAKRLLDFGYHPPTIYFPLVVKGALMIEPTENESKQTLDEFCDTMIHIAEEAKKDPELLKKAPYNTKVRRVDEVRAARNPILTYKPSTGEE